MVRVSDDLDGSSSHGQGGVVAKSVVVTAGGVPKISQGSDEILWPYFVLPFHPCGQSDAFEDFRCLNSYHFDQVGSGNFLGGRFMIG